MMTSRFVVFCALGLSACGGNQPSKTPANPTPEPRHKEHQTHGHQHRFEKADDWVDRFEGTKRDEWQLPDHVVAQMQIKSGMSVADIGAGTGYFLGRLSAAVGESGSVLGLDVEPDMVRYINERAQRESWANVEARVVAGDDPALAPGSVDRVLIVDTWHHISNRSDYAAKLLESLRPGGIVFVVDFTQESPHGPPKKHRLSADAVLSELEAGGLKAAIEESELPHQWIVSATRPAL